VGKARVSRHLFVGVPLFLLLALPARPAPSGEPVDGIYLVLRQARTLKGIQPIGEDELAARVLSPLRWYTLRPRVEYAALPDTPLVPIEPAEPPDVLFVRCNQGLVRVRLRDDHVAVLKATGSEGHDRRLAFVLAGEVIDIEDLERVVDYRAMVISCGQGPFCDSLRTALLKRTIPSTH
jgi:hypothetical protein